MEMEFVGGKEACDEMNGCSIGGTVNPEEFEAEIRQKLVNNSVVYMEPYSKIFSTEFHWNMPYVFDVNKYKEVVPNTRLSDESIRKMKMTCECFTFGDDLVYTLFINSSLDVKGRVDYDCIIFDKSYKRNVNDLISLVTKLTGCIVDIDVEEVNRVNNC